MASSGRPAASTTTSRTAWSRDRGCAHRCGRPVDQAHRPAAGHPRGSRPPGTRAGSSQPSPTRRRFKVALNRAQRTGRDIASMLRYRCRHRRLPSGGTGVDHCVTAVRADLAYHLPAQPLDPPVDLPGRFGACSGAEEVVVDVLLPLVAEKRDDVPEARVPGSQVASSEQVCARAGADKQPELARQAAHLADRRVAVYRDYLVDDVPVPGEDAGDETVGDALDEVPADLAAHQGARLVGLDGDDP